MSKQPGKVFKALVWLAVAGALAVVLYYVAYIYLLIMAPRL
jgi:hypothetical protein